MFRTMGIQVPWYIVIRKYSNVDAVVDDVVSLSMYGQARTQRHIYPAFLK